VDEKKATVIETLEFLANELLREQHVLHKLSVERRKNLKQKQATQEKITEIKHRIDYELAKHKNTLSNENN
jgi:hypothetical protein